LMDAICPNGLIFISKMNGDADLQGIFIYNTHSKKSRPKAKSNQ